MGVGVLALVVSLLVAGTISSNFLTTRSPVRYVSVVAGTTQRLAYPELRISRGFAQQLSGSILQITNRGDMADVVLLTDVSGMKNATLAYNGRKYPLSIGNDSLTSSIKVAPKAARRVKIVVHGKNRKTWAFLTPPLLFRAAGTIIPPVVPVVEDVSDNPADPDFVLDDSFTSPDTAVPVPTPVGPGNNPAPYDPLTGISEQAIVYNVAITCIDLKISTWHCGQGGLIPPNATIQNAPDDYGATITFSPSIINTDGNMPILRPGSVVFDENLPGSPPQSIGPWMYNDHTLYFVRNRDNEQWAVGHRLRIETRQLVRNK